MAGRKEGARRDWRRGLCLRMSPVNLILCLFIECLRESVEKSGLGRNGVRLNRTASAFESGVHEDSMCKGDALLVLVNLRTRVGWLPA
jgi:hypothetical protein